MEQSASVFLNCTEKKYICIDPQATREYQFISVGSVYHEAVFDVLGEYNQIPDEFILLLSHGQPFYVRKEYIARFDEEGDETRTVLCGSIFHLN